VIPVLVDSGFIVALIDRSDGRHQECKSAMESLERILVTCEAVIAESCYLLRSIPGAAERVLINVEEGFLQIPRALSGSTAAIRAIMRKYRNIPASLADACLVCLADEMDTGDILTLDSDFLIYRWRVNRPFNFVVPIRG
jgi:uncharacterized protein